LLEVPTPFEAAAASCKQASKRRQNRNAEKLPSGSALAEERNKAQLFHACPNPK
jgi:hypothetical protein